MSGETSTKDLQEIFEKDDDARQQYIVELQNTAESSSDESKQLLLGRYYLRLAETCQEAESAGHSVQGVDWLIKAARQGNEEATELLKECLDKEQGMTEDNLADVRWCLETPQLEKKARVAAKRLFRSLNPTKASLNKEDYLYGISKLVTSSKEKKLLEKAGKVNANDEVNEDDFVDKVVRRLYGSGRPQLLSSDDAQKDAQFETSNIFQKVRRYPTMTLMWIADYTVDTAGSQGKVWLRSMIPTHQIYMLFVFFIYSLISLDVVLWVLPLITFYMAYAAMVVCTMQMFYGRKKMKDVKAMAEMLNRFNETMQSDSAESNYSWNSLTPYLSFFVALLFTLLSLSMADKTWIPCSEMALIGALLTIACFFALSDKYDYLAILSILLDNISTLPMFIEGLPRIPVLYHIAQLVAGSVYSVEVLPDLHLQFGLPSLAYMVVPLLFLRMAFQNKGQGTYRVLIPHLVCFFWWRMALTFYRYSSWLGLIRASLGWITAIVFLPIFLIVFLIWLTVYVFNAFTLANLLKLITSIILLAIPAAFAFWGSKGFKFTGVDLGKSKSTLVKVIMVIIFASSVIPFTYVFTPPERDVHGNYLSWEKYKELCSKPHWDETNIADTMVTCAHFSGIMVDWTGTVKKIVVKNIDNQAESFINVLPWTIANWLKCTYGDEYPDDCSNTTSTIERDLCEVNTAQNRKCHLKRLNRYQFEMWVMMPIDEENVHDVRVEASHWFKDSLSQIPADAQVRFRAALKGEIGNVWPVLKLYHVECQDCPQAVIGEATMFYQQTGWNVFVAIRNAIQSVWNFFLAPIIEFKKAEE